jgi:hypothetical protein
MKGDERICLRVASVLKAKRSVRIDQCSAAEHGQCTGDSRIVDDPKIDKASEAREIRERANHVLLGEDSSRKTQKKAVEKGRRVDKYSDVT